MTHADKLDLPLTPEERELTGYRMNVRENPGIRRIIRARARRILSGK